MKSIKQVLTERFYTWEDARLLAEQDPEIDLANTTHPYNPITYFEEDVADSQVLEVENAGQEKQPLEKPLQATIDLSPQPEAPDSQPVTRT
jgi:large subunit ribosomal protein L47